MVQIQTIEAMGVPSKEQEELIKSPIYSPPFSETDEFLQHSISRLEEHGYVSSESIQVEDKARQYLNGMTFSYPYCRELFTLAKKGTNEAEHVEVEKKRLKSLFIGASAYGEHEIATDAFHRLVKLRKDHTSLLNEVSAEVGVAKQREIIVQASGRAALGLMSLNGDEAIKQEFRTRERLSNSRRRNLRIAEVTIRNQLRSELPRREGPLVVWRPGIRTRLRDEQATRAN